MVLIGGVQTLVGPIVGAFTFVVLEDRLSAFEFWRAVFGLIIIGVCIAMPQGIAGSARAVLMHGPRENIRSRSPKALIQGLPSGPPWLILHAGRDRPT